MNVQAFSTHQFQGQAAQLSPPAITLGFKGCREDDVLVGSRNGCFPHDIEPSVHEGEWAALQQQKAAFLLWVQSQDLIFNFQKHEWSDHGWKIETIL